MRVEAGSITLIYRDENGDEHTQPLPDVFYSGPLIDEETGDDLEFVAVELRTVDGSPIPEG